MRAHVSPWRVMFHYRSLFSNKKALKKLRIENSLSSLILFGLSTFLIIDSTLAILINTLLIEDINYMHSFPLLYPSLIMDSSLTILIKASLRIELFY